MPPDFPSEQDFQRYAETFFGYGDTSAPIWFIGMEEGGGNTATQIQRRFRAWVKRGEKEIEDLGEFHREITSQELPALSKQPTWQALSRILLAARGEATSKDVVRNFWKNELGRVNSRTCILELNPLPSPGINTWHYGFAFENIRFLKDRVAYNEAFREIRVKELKRLIALHDPVAVVFYGKRYETFWAKIAGGSFVQQNGFKHLEKDGKNYFSIHHPSARVKGGGAERQVELGSAIRKHISRSN